MYLGKKYPKFFPAGPFFCAFQIKCLSKCSYFKRPPLPWKIPDYAPDNPLQVIKIQQKLTITHNNPTITDNNPLPPKKILQQLISTKKNSPVTHNYQ